MTAPADDDATVSTPPPVWTVGIGMVAGSLLIWAWALFPSYFYGDDYAMLYQAREGLSLGYLIEPYSIHIMPFGRFIVWLVGTGGVLNWPAAAAITLVMQLAAGLSGLWMLITLFGRRWGVLAPFAIYLTCAIATPAQMWWVAALNQVPQRIALCLAIGAWVHYLRTKRISWLTLSMLATLFGIACYVKSALILPLLACILLAFFVTGSPRQRMTAAIKNYWPGLVGAALVGLTLVWVYSPQISDVGGSQPNSEPAALANNMLVTALGSGLLGGPWHWWEPNPPVALADPPLLASHLSWAVLILGAGYLALRRKRTGRVWVIFGLYTLGSFVLLANSRAQIVGAIAGLEYRYLTDTAVVFPLCLGLASMRLLQAIESTEPRSPAVLTIKLPDVALVVATVAIAISGTVSSVRYVHYWHDDNQSRVFVENLQAAAEERGLDLADRQVPDVVLTRAAYPENLLSNFVANLNADVRFPQTSSRLAVVDDSGSPHVALIGEGPRSTPGPVEGCGWQLRGVGALTVELTGSTYDYDWWIRLGYLVTADTPVTIGAGDESVDATLTKGVHSLYVNVESAFDEIVVSGLEPGVTLCVDTIEVGQPEAGGAL